MVRYCAAFNCDNDDETAGKTLFSFPSKEKKPNLYKIWSNLVRRADHKPLPSDRLCSDHFDSSCFVHPRFDNIDVQFPLRLKPNSVPTLFNRETATTTVSTDPVSDTEQLLTPPPNSSRKPTCTTPTIRTAAAKREKKRVLDEAFREYEQAEQHALSKHARISEPSATASRPSATVSRPTATASRPSTATYQPSATPPSKATLAEVDTSIVSELPRPHYPTVWPPPPPVPVRLTFSPRTRKASMVSQGMNTVHIKNNDASCQTAPSMTEASCQTSSSTTEASCQTSDMSVSVSTQYSLRDIYVVEEEEESDDDMDDEVDAGADSDDEDDPKWNPEGVQDVDDEIDDKVYELLADTPPAKQRKFIVFEDCLRALLAVCALCAGSCRVFVMHTHGSFISVQSRCTNCFNCVTWFSQPCMGRLPLGNLFLAGGILSSGCSIAPVLRCLNNIGIVAFSERTFHRIQAAYLIPAIDRLWTRSQTSAISLCDPERVSVGGDGRCCSPGHTAKYGSYSLMDLGTGQVLSVKLVQVTETDNSNAMELVGLKRCLAELHMKGVTITDLTTDRHIQVKSYLSAMKQEAIDNGITPINHWFDVWHMAKGVLKKLLAAAKKRNCKIILRWAHSISNHLYWAAASGRGISAAVVQRWLSILNHIADIHEGHGDLFPSCCHDPLEREWVEKGSKAHKEVELIVSSPHLLCDIGQLSPREQTSQVESYHKVVCQFAPKFLHFFYPAMKARLLLAAIHTNENAGRDQAVDRYGRSKWKVSFPKRMTANPDADTGVVTAVKTPPTYSYMEELLGELIALREEFPTYKVALAAHVPYLPPPRCSNKTRVNKSTLVDAHVSRFSKD